MYSLIFIRFFVLELLEVTLRCDLELSTAALSYLLLDKLILKQLFNCLICFDLIQLYRSFHFLNCRYCQSLNDLRNAGAAVYLLAAKFNDKILIANSSDGCARMFAALKDIVGLDIRDVLAIEFDCWKALEFQLFVPVNSFIVKTK